METSVPSVSIQRVNAGDALIISSRSSYKMSDIFTQFEAELPNIKFHKNLFSAFRGVTIGLHGANRRVFTKSS
jgi:hypothetical protein